MTCSTLKTDLKDYRGDYDALLDSLVTVSRGIDDNSIKLGDILLFLVFLFYKSIGVRDHL